MKRWKVSPSSSFCVYERGEEGGRKDEPKGTRSSQIPLSLLSSSVGTAAPLAVVPEPPNEEGKVKMIMGLLKKFMGVKGTSLCILSFAFPHPFSRGRADALLGRSLGEQTSPI